MSIPRRSLAAVAFSVLLSAVSVVLPPAVEPVAAHDDPLQEKADLLNNLPPRLAPDRSDLQIVGLESWLAPNSLTAVLPIPDAHEHRFLFWSYPTTYLAFPRRSIFNFADGVSEECGRRGSRYSPDAAGPPECGRDWFITTATLPMWMRTQMEYRVYALTPWPRTYTMRSSESIPYLLDVGEIQAVGKEIVGSGGTPVTPTSPPIATPTTPPSHTTECTLLTAGPCIDPSDPLNPIPISVSPGDWPKLPVDPCPDRKPVMVASIDAAAIRAAMAKVAANPCGEETDPTVDPGDPDDPDNPDPTDPEVPVVSCDDLVLWGEWLECLRDSAVDRLAAIAVKAYELLPAWAQAVVRAIDGCAEFGGDVLRDVWEAAKEAGKALKDFPEWLKDQLDEIRLLIDAIRDDPEAFLSEVLDEFLETETLDEDKAKWTGKMICKMAAAILLGGPTGARLALKATQWRKDRGYVKCNSFPTGTPVLMADGRLVPIELVSPGDLVLAADPLTGQWTPRAVEAQWSHLDEGQMATVTLADGSSVTATDHHKFWVDSAGAWVELEDVEPGDLLLTPDGVTTVAAVEESGHTQTLVWELDVAVDDSFAVSTGTTEVLVHNESCFLPNSPPPGYKGRSFEELVPGGKIPTLKGNPSFAEWWNRLSKEELDYLSRHDGIYARITRNIRGPGGKHEWCMCSKMQKAKEWGLTMEQIQDFTTDTGDVYGRISKELLDDYPQELELFDLDDGWGHPTGDYDGDAASKLFHDELSDLIDGAKDKQDFLNKLPALRKRWGIPESALTIPDWGG